MLPGKIIHRGIYSLTETLWAPPKSLGKVARERIPGELSPSTYPGRHVARDEFPQRQVARERREMSLGIMVNVVVLVPIGPSLLHFCLIFLVRSQQLDTIRVHRVRMPLPIKFYEH
ncbi:hypothetical protein Tco_1524390 [Tanacetum coccineum]